MHFGISSLFITLCISLPLIFLFSYVLKHEKSYHLFRADLLFVLAFIICLRLFFPIELPFTTTIFFPSIMNPLMTFLNISIYHKIKLVYLLGIIWIVGVLIKLGMYIRNIILVKKTRITILQHAKHFKMSELLSKECNPNYDVYITSYVSSPMVIGFEKCILLPEIEFTNTELTNILSHEAQHLKQNDIVLKQLVSFLTILYWWFIPIYLLQKNIDFYIEVRADEKATDSFDAITTLEYAETLLEVQKKIQPSNNKIPPNLSSYLIGESQGIISYRINYLINKQINTKTNKLILCLLILLPLMTNSIIFEAYFEDNECLEGTMSEDEFINSYYLVEHKDGSYSIVNGEEKYPISDPSDYIESGMNIIQE